MAILLPTVQDYDRYLVPKEIYEDVITYNKTEIINYYESNPIMLNYILTFNSYLQRVNIANN